MVKRSKRYIEAAKLIENGKYYSINEAISLLKLMVKARFDETVELSLKLGVDPRHADQLVRGTVCLPHGTGKQLQVLVVAKGEKAKEAEEAGADYVGAEDLINKIKEGWLDFEATIATPDLMKQVGQLGKILGPRGLMPSPKVGTVTFEVGKMVREIKAGRLEFRVDREANIHLVLGKSSFSEEQITANVAAAIDAILRAKPAACKGQYIRGGTLAMTMSPGIGLDVQDMIRIKKE